MKIKKSELKKIILEVLNEAQFKIGNSWDAYTSKDDYFREIILKAQQLKRKGKSDKEILSILQSYEKDGMGASKKAAIEALKRIK